MRLTRENRAWPAWATEAALWRTPVRTFLEVRRRPRPHSKCPAPLLIRWENRHQLGVWLVWFFVFFFFLVLFFFFFFYGCRFCFFFVVSLFFSVLGLFPRGCFFSTMWGSLGFGGRADGARGPPLPL